MDKQTRSYYEEYWKTSEKWSPAGIDLAPDLAEMLASRLQPTDMVLDIGCGNGGHYGEFVRSRVAKHFGVDVSEPAVEEAKKRGITAFVHNLDEPLPFVEDYFDVAICIEVLEHLIDPLFVAREIQRTVKPGGIAIIAVPNAAYFGQRLRLLGGKFVAGGSPNTVESPWCDPHIRFFTKRTVEAFLQAAGLRIITFKGAKATILEEIPLLTPVLAKLFGYQRLRSWSIPLQSLSTRLPALFAGNFYVVARVLEKPLQDNKDGALSGES